MKEAHLTFMEMLPMSKLLQGKIPTAKRTTDYNNLPNKYVYPTFTQVVIIDMIGLWFQVLLLDQQRGDLPNPPANPDAEERSFLFLIHPPGKNLLSGMDLLA
jgi:hypothetical protein